MKLPLWTKDGEGKWVPFPADRLHIFEDGKVGFTSVDAPFWVHYFCSIKRSAYTDRSMVRYQPSMDRFILVETE